MGVADSQFTAVGGQQEFRVHFLDRGEAGVVGGGKGAERSVHETGDGRRLQQWNVQLRTQDGCRVGPKLGLSTQLRQVYWLAGRHCGNVRLTLYQPMMHIVNGLSISQ